MGIAFTNKVEAAEEILDFVCNKIANFFALLLFSAAFSAYAPFPFLEKINDSFLHLFSVHFVTIPL